MIIGEKIRRAIADSPFSVTDVASAINVSNQNLYKMFKKESMDTKHLLNICAVLGIETSYFLGEAETSIDTNSTLFKSLNAEIEQLRERITELEEQLEDKRMILKLLKESEAMSAYNLLTPKEKRGIDYSLDLNDPDALLKDLEKQPFDFHDEEAKWDYIEQMLKERKKKK